MKLLYVILLFSLLGMDAPCIAQQILTLDITATGGHASGSGGHANIAIGQVAYSRRTPSSSDYIVREGVLQLLFNTTPLPISLLQFEVEYQAEKHQALLTWATATEQGNDFFSVERSTDGINFEPIGQVKGAGNSDLAQHYEWADHSPKQGISYYRLKQIDFDGTFSYSPIRNIYIDMDAIGLSVYPNPTQSHITISLPQLPANKVSYRLVNMAGQVITNGQLHAIQQQVNLNRLPTGTYILQLEGLDFPLHTIKIIKI